MVGAWVQRALRVGTIVPGAAAPFGRRAGGFPDAARYNLCVDSRMLVSVLAMPWYRRIAPGTRATILTREMIEPGMNIDGVGGDCPGQAEWHPDVLRSARVFVEFEPQTDIEGDIRPLGADFSVVDLWRVPADTALGRQNDTPVTVFDSVGFALEDDSALRFVDRLAFERGGQPLCFSRGRTATSLWARQRAATSFPPVPSCSLAAVRLLDGCLHRL